MIEKKQKAPKLRGRPPVIFPAYYTFLKAMFPEIRTRRGILNKFYEIHAFGVIQKMQEEEGVLGLEFLRDPSKEHCNWGVLRELGKLPTEKYIREIALAVCEAEREEDKEDKKTVKQWEYVLRHYRMQDDVYRYLNSETVSEIDEENSKPEQETQAEVATAAGVG